MCTKSELYGIFVGAETGLLKGVTSDHNSWHNLTSVSKVTREKEITCMCWQNDDQTEVCIGHRDGSIDLFSNSENELIHSYTEISTDGYLKHLLKWNSAFVTCTDTGKLKVTDGSEEKLVMDVGADIYSLCQNNEQRHIVATGGKENDLKIWNLQHPEEPIFKAKNVRHDWLNLRVPIWVRDAAFLNESNKIVTCTGYHQVRVYDPSTPRRRPVMDIEVDEYPLTSLSLRHGYNQVVVGNTHGLMALVDLRGKGYIVQKYKGFAGSIRDIQCHPSQDMVISCSLDRFLRIHDINTRQLLSKFYMKSRLNCCLVADKDHSQMESSEPSLLSPDEIKQECPEGEVDCNQSESSEDELLWSSMGTVKTKHIQTTKHFQQSEDDDSDFEEGSQDENEVKSDAKKNERKLKTETTKRKQLQCRKGKKRCKSDHQRNV